MSEKPIIFSGEMVRDILEGRKAQTRRVIKPQPVHVETCFGESVLYRDSDNEIPWKYQLGDRLWVRETWAGNNQRVAYKADMTSYGIAHDLDYVTGIYTPYKKMFPSPVLNVPKWKSPIHMPRWASRIDLIIALLRPERLLDISEIDARAEGFNSIEEFLTYWDILNKKRGYGTHMNPWNWVIGW